jgi:hypothetical protein
MPSCEGGVLHREPVWSQPTSQVQQLCVLVVAEVFRLRLYDSLHRKSTSCQASAKHGGLDELLTGSKQYKQSLYYVFFCVCLYWGSPTCVVVFVVADVDK